MNTLQKKTESVAEKSCSDVFRKSERITAQKMKFSIKEFFSKCDQIRRKLQIWSHLLKKSLMENFIFYAVKLLQPLVIITEGYLLIIENAFLTAGVCWDRGCIAFTFAILKNLPEFFSKCCSNVIKKTYFHVKIFLIVNLMFDGSPKSIRHFKYSHRCLEMENHLK